MEIYKYSIYPVKTVTAIHEVISNVNLEKFNLKFVKKFTTKYLFRLYVTLNSVRKSDLLVEILNTAYGNDGEIMVIGITFRPISNYVN